MLVVRGRAGDLGEGGRPPATALAVAEEGEEARVKRGGSGDKNVLTVRLRRAISESGGVE